jgi:hypothetical protein
VKLKPRVFKGRDGKWHKRWEGRLPPGPKRALGINPRAKGTNPRAKGTNPNAKDPSAGIVSAVLKDIEGKV